MFRIILITLLCTSKLFATTKAYTGPIDFGRPATQEELSTYPITQYPDGKSLPIGQGTYAEGLKLYGDHCASCHGSQMEGKVAFGAPRLIGGRGTITGKGKPIKTIESFWPNAVSLYDYISRAMPFLTPKILTANEVYALCAYILGEARIISKTDQLDQDSLPKVSMPNEGGFIDPFKKNSRPAAQLA